MKEEVGTGRLGGGGGGTGRKQQGKKINRKKRRKATLLALELWRPQRVCGVAITFYAPVAGFQN